MRWPAIITLRFRSTPGCPSEIAPLDDVIAGSLAPRRFYMLLLSVFAAVALLLAVVGIYGVISYSVSQRTHEIGVRLALGARPREVLWIVLSQGLAVAAIGVAIGLASSLVLSRFLRSMLGGHQADRSAHLPAGGFVFDGSRAAGLRRSGAARHPRRSHGGAALRVREGIHALAKNP
ncbi:MAG TPA: FtsX-like permease family protein [Terriglobales bacterium]|nr:FtsX-like permease family protein [Terriglobales bacterium]